MEVRGLSPGVRLLLEDGSIAEVIEPSSDDVTVRVRYLESPFDEARVGTEGEVSDYDVVAFAGESEVDSSLPPSG
jgi:hypothetical protein